MKFERWWPQEETTTILGSEERLRAGRIVLVKMKGPRWFEANCISNPSVERVRSGRAITPALLINL